MIKPSRFTKSMAIIIVMSSATYALGAYLSLQGLLPPAVRETLPLKWPGDLSPSPVAAKPDSELTAADRLVLGARREVPNGTLYDASYQKIAYPGGAVDPRSGACSILILRALQYCVLELQV